ncbi:glycosyltransferase [Marinovum sp.]|uniref:glycosyltransferase n=1 Tax=Marinovum sp. TaxID=2024839 RepID=UPI002B26B297|nr:glycosyltransferase [Marinovum sp.]
MPSDRRRLWLAAFWAGWLIAAAFLGNLALAAAAAVFLLAQIAVTVMQFICSARLQPATPPAARRIVPRAEFISVQVATHAEPPELVIRTLEALLNQKDAPPYEIIVIDNNTDDEALWRPVEAFANRHPLALRFVHAMGVKGAKAGALRIARQMADPRTTHIAVVDADYVTTPDFLARAAERLSAQSLDFVQFPQAYRGEGAAAGPAQDLSDYFCRHACMADGARAMLLTGTLSVISLRALDAAGGWQHTSSTEDAELGVRLQMAGFDGGYVDARVGEGLLPLSVRALGQQRARWAAGNFRTLLLHAPFKGLGLRRRIAVAAQLSAWLNFAVPAVAGLLWGLAALWLDAPLAGVILGLSLATLGFALLSAVLPVGRNALTRGLSSRAAAQAVLSRLSVLPAAGFGTLSALMPLPQGFTVTPKTWRRPSGPGTEASLTILASFGLAGLAALSGLPLVAIAAALAALAMSAASFATAQALRSYRIALKDNAK